VNRPRADGFIRSVQDRLKNEVHATNRPFAEMLELFAVERFLHRLGRSQHRDRFVLKGALLLRHWLGADTRPTRDWETPTVASRTTTIWRRYRQGSPSTDRRSSNRSAAPSGAV
jgi:hypothetical protein